ncbi:hypothetical protein HYH02_006183 [Chlamydomonas schloesseri]|uniref:Uncharacterized protein n=1 Tax=Chlamydomonas schloesseri TaxID=2026947 RepID=A0A835WK17_9CHLO|nr:hypothetical protein HYH02_006183 [Chlamydomonas schloesseri]|eukprot:KAG2448832.1 hypothetical protein HYH02_006183 [Chlamydomonas schloesseri]
MSKRKSPALVGVVNGERLLGEEAFSFAVRYPEQIIARARDMLGKDADDPTLTALFQQHGLPYKLVANAEREGAASVQIGEEVYSPEELVGSILYYARQIAEAQAGGPVTDAVITVPAYFGQRQRQAMADAADLAGLNLMGLINTHTAAALQYGIERDFANRSQTILLYDMGSGTTEVALVKYSTYTVKEAGKPKVYNQLEVRDVDWDDSLGGNMLDMALARHFAAEFSDKAKLPGVDVTQLPKAMAKLRRQVRRTKEMLSANSAAPCTVEELYDGKDFQSSITRDDFEVLAADFFTRAAAPLKRIIERNSLKPEDIDAVELIGGGSRVPRLQAALSEALGGRGLDRHLDADEAIALGAGLFAANLSTSFRLRKFGMVDLTMYGVSLSLDHVVLGEGAAAALPEGAEPLQKVRNLLPFMKKLPNKRVVRLDGVAADPLRFSLAYNTSTHHGLPPGVKAAELADFEATGVEDVIKRYNTSGQISLRFEADYSGLLRLDKVEAVVEYEVMEEKIIEVPVNETEAGAGATNATTTEGGDAKADMSSEGDEKAAKADADKQEQEQEKKDRDEGDDDSDTNGNGDEEKAEEGAKEEAEGKEEGEAGEKEGAKADKAEGDAKEGADASGAGSAANATDAGANATNASSSKPATVIKRIQVPKQKVAKVPLKVGGRGWLFPALSGPVRTASKAVLAKFVAAEAVKRDIAKSRNDLESYIIAMKESLETDELMQKVSTEEQRESFRARLTDEEDWLYMEADEGEGAQQFKDRLQQLKDIGEPIKRRAEELELRPKLLETVRKQLELKQSVVKAWADTKPWITEEERESMAKQLAEVEADLNAKEEAQSKKADHEEPAFSVTEVATAWDKFDKAFNKLNNKKKPKPPPEPKPAADGEAKAEGAGAGKAEGEGEGAEAEGDGDATKPDSEAGAGAGSAEGADGDAGAKGDGAKADEGKKKDDAKAQAPKKEQAKEEEPKKKEAPKKEQAKTDETKKAKKEETKKDNKKGKADAKKDTKKEAPKKEAPKKEAPKKEAPKKEAPKKEAPKKEAPKKEAPKKEAPKKEEPKKKEAGGKDDKKSWSWNKKKGEEL